MQVLHSYLFAELRVKLLLLSGLLPFVAADVCTQAAHAHGLHRLLQVLILLESMLLVMRIAVEVAWRRLLPIWLLLLL